MACTLSIPETSCACRTELTMPTWPQGEMTTSPLPRMLKQVACLCMRCPRSTPRGWLASFRQRLDELRWRDGRNLVTQVQWWNEGPEQMRAWAAELVSRSPDIAVAFTNLALEVLKPIAENVPIVFVRGCWVICAVQAGGMIRCE